MTTAGGIAIAIAALGFGYLIYSEDKPKKPVKETEPDNIFPIGCVTRLS